MLSTLLLQLVILLMLGAILVLAFWSNIQTYRTTAKVSEDIGPCALCHEKRVGLRLFQIALTGIVFIYTSKNFYDFACPAHARSIHRQFQFHTLLKGWWSLRGFIRTPILLSMNSLYFNQYNRAVAKVRSKLQVTATPNK